jgi:organic hydroperoxide reductase OsmC/OhrA
VSDHEHRAIISWKRNGADFRGGKYPREHVWTFDGGITVAASASPAIVPVPYSNPACLDPEEAFVAALSSCHMLTFLHLASRKGFEVESYHDEAVGVMTANEQGALWISSITLHPNVEHAGKNSPTFAELDELHHRAHEECFLANSIKTRITIRSANHKA